MKLINGICYLVITLLYLLFHQVNFKYLEIRSDKFFKDNTNQGKILDIIHEIVPYNDRFVLAPHIIVLLLFVYLLSEKFDDMSRIIGCIITMLLIRELVNQITVLPKDVNCNIDCPSQSNFIGGCYDKIFSGHFGMTLLLTLFLLEYGLINIPIMVIINLISCFFILLVRSHYTIDIVVSIFVVTIIYQNNLNIYNFIDNQLEKFLL